jgi:hypothetical protein
MKSWSTLVLALISLALLSFFYFGGKDMPSTTERQEAARRLVSIESDKVTRVELTNASGEFLLVKDSTGAWRLEKPIRTDADASAVSQLLSDLEFTSRRGTLRPSDFEDYAKALESFGLKNPRARIKIQQNGSAWSVALGNETAVGTQLYALASDGKKEDLVVVEKFVQDNLLIGLDRLRSRSVFTFMTPLVDGIALRQGEQAAEVTKSGDGWKIVRPTEGPADETKVVSFLAGLLSARVVDFVTEEGGDVGSYGLQTPAVVIEIKSSGSSQILRIGQPVPGKDLVYAQRAEEGASVVTLPKALVDQITGMLDQVRDRRLAAFQDPFDFTSWRIERRGGLLMQATAVGRKWVLDSGHDADSSLVNALILGLRDQQGEGMQLKSPEALKRAGLEAPQAVITLTPKKEGDSEPQPLVIRLGTSRKGKLTADSSRLPYLVEVSDALLSLLAGGSTDWHARQVRLAREGKQPIRLTWKRPAGDTLLSRAEDGTWKHADGTAAQPEAVNRLLGLLQTLEVTAWVPLKEADFAKPRFSLEITDDGQETRTVDFVLMGKDGQNRARIRGDTAAFILKAEDFQVFDTPPAPVSK